MSGEVSLNRYKIHNLQNVYIEFTNFIFKLEKHIIKLYKNNIIATNERNKYMSRVYDIVKEINSQYNVYIENKCESQDDENVVKINNNSIFRYTINENDDEMYEQMMDCISLYDTINFKPKNKSDIIFFSDELINPLQKVDQNIRNLCKEIGFSSIIHCLDFVIGKEWRILYDKTERDLIELYDHIFVPFGFNLEKISNLVDSGELEIADCIINNEKCMSYKRVFFKESTIENDIILNRIAKLYLLYINPNNVQYYIILTGYIINDSVNVLIKTSQIGNKYLYKKKKNIEKIINTNDTNKQFIKSYIKHTSLYEFIVYTEEQYVQNLMDKHEKFLGLINKSFTDIIKEFTKKDNGISDMYEIIHLLLLGSEENINIAGLLFGITKGKKMDTNIANTIYNNLNYLSQIKLKKNNADMKKELKKIQTMTMDDIDYKKQILSIKNMPDNVKALAFEKVEEMMLANNDYYKQSLYVKTLIKFPWPSSDDDQIYKDLEPGSKKAIEYMDRVKNQLDKVCYGHTEAKKTLFNYVGQMITSPNSSGCSLSIYGPSGTGKTLVAKSVADALGLKFIQITLGGQNDGELLHGHGYTYGSAQPGLIIKKMAEIGKNRCIIYFDELDKSCEKHSGGVNEITSILIHLTDRETNSKFQDRFFQGVEFPLNRCIMIFSYNDKRKIDNILLKRFVKKIEVKAYKISEKIEIVKKFILPEICGTIGYKTDQITIDTDSIEFLIEKYTMEAGVRDLKHKIETILLELNIDRIYGEGTFEDRDSKVAIDKEIIQKILKKPYSPKRKINTTCEVGIINGLYTNSTGLGGISPIQIFPLYTSVADVNFTFKTTGNLSEVSKESIMCSFTAALHYIHSNKEKYNIDNLDKYVKNNFPYGFHVHKPDTATPKDGPSAGSATSVAFVSRLLNIPIKNTIAMTGEIELDGKITEIGGLEYKLMGAKKAGVKLVLIPKENEKDLEDIKRDNKKLINKNFQVKCISKLEEAIELTLMIKSTYN